MCVCEVLAAIAGAGSWSWSWTAGLAPPRSPPTSHHQHPLLKWSKGCWWCEDAGRCRQRSRGCERRVRPESADGHHVASRGLARGAWRHLAPGVWLCCHAERAGRTPGKGGVTPGGRWGAAAKAKAGSSTPPWQGSTRKKDAYALHWKKPHSQRLLPFHLPQKLSGAGPG